MAAKKHTLETSEVFEMAKLVPLRDEPFLVADDYCSHASNSCIRFDRSPNTPVLTGDVIGSVCCGKQFFGMGECCKVRWYQ